MRTPNSVSSTEVVEEPGYWLGGVILTALISPQAYTLTHPGAKEALRTGYGLVFVGFYIITVGCVFLASYYCSHKSFLFRWFAWVCEHGSFPASRKMAFFYFALSVISGGMAILDGLGFPHT